MKKIPIISLVLFLLLGTICYANYAPKIEVDNCINLGNGKYILPKEAVVIVDQVCKAEPCYQIPTGFMCQTYSAKDQVETNEVLCSVIELDQNPTPTEPIICSVNPCDPNLCPSGYPTCTYTPGEISFFCSKTTQILGEDAAKKSAYDTQKAAAESTSAGYQESILYGNLQGYCNYVNGVPCVQLPPATFNATASSFSYLTGKNVAEIKKLMRKKIGKK